MKKKEKKINKEIRNQRGLRFQSSPNFSLKETKTDILNNELFSLNLLQKIVKSYQIDFLSKNIENNKHDYEYVIDSLFNFKNTLNNSFKILKEEKQLLITKVNYIFYTKQNKENIKIFHNHLKNEKINEIEEIKNLNFTIKNEINKINYINSQIKEEINFIKKIDDFIDDEINEIYCHNRNEISIAQNELKFELQSLENKYNQILFRVIQKEKEINGLNSDIEKIKNILLNEKFDKKYIDTDNVIEEEASENYSSFFRNNSFDSKMNNSKDNCYKNLNYTYIPNTPMRLNDNSFNFKFNLNIIKPQRKLSNQVKRFKKHELHILNPKNE